MPTYTTVIGLSDGGIDPDNQMVAVTLSGLGGKPIKIVGKVGIMEQVASGLGRLVRGLRDARTAKGLSNGDVADVEAVAQFGVMPDLLEDAVVLRIVSKDNIPFNFSISSTVAIQMADRLRAHSGGHKPAAGSA